MLSRRQETMHVHQAMRSTFKSLRARKQVVDLGKEFLGHWRAGSHDLKLFHLKSAQSKFDTRRRSDGHLKLVDYVFKECIRLSGDGNRS